MTKRFYTPLFDFIFKLIFGDQRNIAVLTALLAAALDLPEVEFDHLTIIDPFLKREFEGDKMGILDVKVHTQSGAVINVEMQVETNQELRKRIVISTAKMLTEQIKRWDEYNQAERVVSIVICGGILIPEEAGYYNRYSIRNAQSGAEFTDLIEINVLELGKLPKESDGGRLFNWGQFFKAQNPEELAMIAEKDPAIKQAVALVMELNDDERARLIADAQWKQRMDQAGRERQSYREGTEEGRNEVLELMEQGFTLEQIKEKLSGGRWPPKSYTK
ncbi:Rpn family recombination-promoting nuclease/putative transposase [Treponema primitia]|uniref:Rpn family recombination-promoting nuclease/putative transposase n=1 Tax=Treponema primitia TaxID=88058 RepID=UPI000255507A|nr:Rpn family recombination-promoting nuclease/putative transposase [Treponema primitia]